MSMTSSILIVEDDADLRAILSSMLVDILPGATPCFESTGEAASRVLRELQSSGGRCRLVISDVLLPGSVTGVDLLASCRRQFPELPFLLTSGLPEEFARGLVSAAHVEAAILPKPFTPAQLRAMCHELLPASAAARRRAA